MLVNDQWEFPDNKWITGDVKTIRIPSEDTIQAYQLDVIVKHSDEYAFQNLYIRILTTYPSGKEISSVTSLELADTNGSWSGDCSSSSCIIELPLQQRFTFPEKGEYKWSIEPYMRMDTIEGIKSLTVLCRKAAS